MEIDYPGPSLDRYPARRVYAEADRTAGPRCCAVFDTACRHRTTREAHQFTEMMSLLRHAQLRCVDRPSHGQHIEDPFCMEIERFVGHVWYPGATRSSQPRWPRRTEAARPEDGSWL